MKTSLRKLRWWPLSVPVAACAVLILVGAASAEPGVVLTSFDVPAGCFGVGVAYDGADILYTCFGTAAIFRTDVAGADVGSVPVVDASGNPISLDAIAWDPSEGVLWGGQTNVQGTTDCGVWSVDLANGIATLRFAFPSDSDGFFAGLSCQLAYFDGLTVDTGSNTLYVSPLLHTQIHHVNKTGELVAGEGIPFESLTTGQCPSTALFGFTGCLTSGLAIGVDGTLFAGTAADGKIMALDPSIPGFLGEFASYFDVDAIEDLECGPLFTKTDGAAVETIVSRNLGTRIDVFEAPEGTCVSPAVEPIEVSTDYRFAGRGPQLPVDPDSGSFLLEAVTKKKDNTVSSYNPGQFFAVTTINPLADLDELWIVEDYSDCTTGENPLSSLNPAAGKGAAAVIVLEVIEGETREVANAKSANVSVGPDRAVVHLEDVFEDSTILVLVKFGPGLRGLTLPDAPDNMCVNEITASTVVDGSGVSSTARLIVEPKK